MYRELAQPQCNTGLKLVKSNIDESNWSLTYWGTCNLFFGFFNLIESCILNYMIINFCRQSLHYLSSNIYRLCTDGDFLIFWQFSSFSYSFLLFNPVRYSGCNVPFQIYLLEFTSFSLKYQHKLNKRDMIFLYYWFIFLWQISLRLLKYCYCIF